MCCDPFISGARVCHRVRPHNMELDCLPECPRVSSAKQLPTTKGEYNPSTRTILSEYFLATNGVKQGGVFRGRLKMRDMKMKDQIAGVENAGKVSMESQSVKKCLKVVVFVCRVIPSV